MANCVAKNNKDNQSRLPLRWPAILGNIKPDTSIQFHLKAFNPFLPGRPCRTLNLFFKEWHFSFKKRLLQWCHNLFYLPVMGRMELNSVAPISTHWHLKGIHYTNLYPYYVKQKIRRVYLCVGRNDVILCTYVSSSFLLSVIGRYICIVYTLKVK